MFLFTAHDDVVQPTPIMDMIDMMALEFDGDNPAEPKTCLEIEDAPNQDGDFVATDDLRDSEVFSRKELLEQYKRDKFQLRDALRQVTTRQELYACVDFGVMIDDAMNQDPTWHRPFDMYAALSREFAWAEERVTRLERNLALEKARLDAYAKSIHVMSFFAEKEVAAAH
jgi:hypothetical protein